MSKMLPNLVVTVTKPRSMLHECRLTLVELVRIDGVCQTAWDSCAAADSAMVSPVVKKMIEA